MSGLSSMESLERCEQCGTDVGFLSSCIVCGTPVPAGTEEPAEVTGAPPARRKLALVDAVPRSSVPPRPHAAAPTPQPPQHAQPRVAEPEVHLIHYPVALLRPGSPGWDDTFPARVEEARKARLKRRIALVLIGMALLLCLLLLIVV